MPIPLSNWPEVARAANVAYCLHLALTPALAYHRRRKRQFQFLRNFDHVCVAAHVGEP